MFLSGVKYLNITNSILSTYLPGCGTFTSHRDRDGEREGEWSNRDKYIHRTQNYVLNIHLMFYQHETFLSQQSSSFAGRKQNGTTDAKTVSFATRDFPICIFMP